MHAVILFGGPICVLLVLIFLAVLFPGVMRAIVLIISVAIISAVLYLASGPHNAAYRASYHPAVDRTQEVQQSTQALSEINSAPAATVRSTTPQDTSLGKPSPQEPNRSTALGDALDDWCAKVKLPSSIAICSDQELRSLTIERGHAYEEARTRLSPDQQKTLLADQNNWVRSYAVACGLARDTPPTLPLAPTVRDCMAQAGRARIVYLREYGNSESVDTYKNRDKLFASPSPIESGCRDLNCYYRACMDLVAHAQEEMIETLRKPGVPAAALQAYLSRDLPAQRAEAPRDCAADAQIDVWCHGNEDCVDEGQMGRDWAKREGRPMTEQDWRSARCVNESIKRGEDRNVTLQRCGR